MAHQGLFQLCEHLNHEGANLGVGLVSELDPLSVAHLVGVNEGLSEVTIWFAYRRFMKSSLKIFGSFSCYTDGFCTCSSHNWPRDNILEIEFCKTFERTNLVYISYFHFFPFLVLLYILSFLIQSFTGQNNLFLDSKKNLRTTGLFTFLTS